jgi:hypothetical protein
MGTVTLEQVGGEKLALPLRIQEALGELVDSAKEGLLALSDGGDAHAHPARRQRQPQADAREHEPVESMIEIVRWTQRNVKRWSSGEMALRWTAAGMLEAERQFRKIIGYRDLATLLMAIERDHHRRHTAHIPTKEAAIVVVF